jgi:hypothetical protein
MYCTCLRGPGSVAVSSWPDGRFPGRTAACLARSSETQHIATYIQVTNHTYANTLQSCGGQRGEGCVTNGCISQPLSKGSRIGTNQTPVLFLVLSDWGSRMWGFHELYLPTFISCGFSKLVLLRRVSTKLAPERVRRSDGASTLKTRDGPACTVRSALDCWWACFEFRFLGLVFVRL